MSARVLDRTGGLVLAHVGRDDQWRVPVPLAAMSPHLVAATIAVEDERFEHHGGVDVWAIARALGQNVAAGRIVSGASTITMQLCHMTEPRARGWRTKMMQAFRARQLERIWDKKRILEAYLNVAPYGGNLRGVEAAAQHYFGRSARDLSLAEAALLAGIPQSPNRLRPDRCPRAAERRRATVLRRMEETGAISGPERQRALAEPILVAAPANPGHERRLAAHFGWLAVERRPAGGVTTLSPTTQQAVARVCESHARQLPSRSDLAVTVIEIDTGDVVAMIGSASPSDPIDGQVNGAVARRSPGSTLKPFIYAAAFASGRLRPESLIPDRPLERAGWRPRNFDGRFLGEVTAAQALRASLNVPAIRVAEELGLARCVGTLQSVGLALPTETVARGGLALVTGAVEVSLLDLTNAYATLGRGGLFQSVRLFLDEQPGQRRALSAESCAHIDAILTHGGGAGAGPSQPWFMAKTGTSSGHRDAWAVGHNGRFAIGVWVGSFAGPGDREYVGADAAAPLLERLFGLPDFGRPAAPRHGTTAGCTAAAQPSARAVTPMVFAESTSLRITAPAAGARLIARDGAAFVELAANLAGGGIWFIDGTALPGMPARTRVAPGNHEARFVSDDGRSASARFVVLARLPSR